MEKEITREENCEMKDHYQLEDWSGPKEGLDHCADKIAFLNGFFTNTPEDISEREGQGLVWILWEIELELRTISDEVWKLILRNKKLEENKGEQKKVPANGKNGEPRGV